MEYLVSRPIKQGIDVVSDDLPKELTDLRLELAKVTSKKLILEVLNEIIW
jgi:hypothetical protein